MTDELFAGVEMVDFAVFQVPQRQDNEKMLPQA